MELIEKVMEDTKIPDVPIVHAREISENVGSGPVACAAPAAAPVQESSVQTATDADAAAPAAAPVQESSVQIATDADENDTTENDSLICAGDHLYSWCSFAGIGMFQRHGVVFQEQIDGDGNQELILVDCSVLLPETKPTDNADEDKTFNNRNPLKTLVRKRPGSRVLVEKDDRSRHWHKVTYQAAFWQRHLHRSGTCTSVPSDPVGLVLMRLQFLVQHSDTLPPHHALRANCECVAVWIKTGTWATLQASSFLELTAAGQVKSATTLAMMASSQQVTVPAAGIWGYLGFTTKVSLISTQPLLLPAIATYGLLSVGGPVWMLYRARKAWTETTERLHEEFWNAALEDPDSFAQNMTEYSSLRSASC